MRYKVTFRGNGQLTFHEEYTNWHSVMINLDTDGLKQSRNNIFNEDETKAFELPVTLIVSSDNGYGEVAGDSYFDINYAITVHNGEVDLQVKPFKFDPYGLDWDISEYDGNGSEDCAEILSEEVLDIDIDWNFNANGIKQCLLKYITVEEIED